MHNTIKKTLILLVVLYSFPAILQSQWFALNAGTNRLCAQVFFVDNNTGYVTGDTTMKTTNGGTNWSFLPVRSSWSIFFFNSLTGFVSSRTNNSWGISKTTDGGLSWSFTQTGQFHAWTICFVNDLTGWAGTGVQFSGEIYKTTNGGANWISIYNYDCQMTTRFYNTNIGYTNSYYGQFRKSTDGGLSWTQIPLPSTGYGYQYMQLLDTNIIYMCSFDGYFAKSTNGASSWLVYPTGNTMPLFSLSFVNSQTGYCVGGNSSGVPYIVKTTNAGVNWSVQQGVPPYELYGVYFINANTGWAVGDSGRIIKTTNGGGVVGVEHYANEIPEKFNLYQNFPNPFNPSTTIRFDIAEPGFVNLYVYDILGREVEVLVNKFLQPGRYEAAFDASLLSSGIYFNKLKSGDYTNIKKLVLIK